jgi:hypothetical protein
MKLPKIKTQRILSFIPYVNISIPIMWFIYIVARVCVGDRTKVIWRTNLYGFAGVAVAFPIMLIQQYLDMKLPYYSSFIDYFTIYLIFAIISNSIILYEKSYGIK